jgi:hypothetical protein
MKIISMANRLSQEPDVLRGVLDDLLREAVVRFTSVQVWLRYQWA